MVKAMGSSIYWTYSSVIIQKSVDNAYMGRAFSIDMAGFQLATVISVIVVGALVDTLGEDHARAIAFGTVLASLVPLVLWALAVPWLERREARDGGKRRTGEMVKLESETV
jgi:predicted MFS family arabinose efflux permease